jgi:hypothetical protein
MINFKDFIEEEITEQEIDELIESLEWEDIIELYDTEDLILDEDISSTQRIKMGQKMKSRKALLALARLVKLKRAAAMNEKNSIEARTSRVLSMMKNLPQKLLPKIREIEKKRLHGKDNK